MRRSKLAWALTVVATLLVSAQTPATSADEAPGTATEPEALAPTYVRVMDWNFHGGRAPGETEPDIPRAAQVIRDQGVDIVTIHEINRQPEADLVRQLADELGWELGLNVHFGPADRPGQCGSQEAGDAGNAIMTSHEIVERVTVPLPSNGCNPDGTGSVKRSLAGARIDLGNNQVIRVYTSHFTSGQSDTAVGLRQQQAAATLDYIDPKTGPLLFTGDLNTKPSGVIRDWFVDAGFQDTGAAHADEPTHNDARIDYIFARSVTVTDGHVVDTGASDHKPVVMEMEVS